MYLTHKKYLQRIKSLNIPYWNEGKRYRWDYMAVALRMMKSCGNNTLEMGTMGIPINDNSYLLDIDKKGLVNKRGKLHDLNKIPYKWFTDNCFDCSCGLQVFEHLENQPAIFKELCRISKNVVLSFPYKWNHGDHMHKGIDEDKIAEWTCHVEPDEIVLIKNRIIYFWKGV